MSRRAIKRYTEVLEAGKNASDNPDESSEASETETMGVGSRAGGSLFALLDADNTDEEDDESEGDYHQEGAREQREDSESKPQDMPEEHNEDEVEDEGASNVPETPPEVQDTGSELKQKKKKKRRKGRKGKKRIDAAQDQENDPDWIALNESTAEQQTAQKGTSDGSIPDSYFGEEDGEDVREEANRIMALIEGMILTDRGNNTSRAPLVPRDSRVLHVEPRLLNADSELKKLFGAKVVESERREEEASSAQVRRRGRPPGKAHLRRKISLVSPRETWFAYAPGLTMVVDNEGTNKDTPEIRYFRYQHESSYTRVQNEYRSFVNMHDPNLLAELVSRHPYHVDTLLQLAELYRQMGELDRGAEHIERAIYVLETAWNIMFKPFDGNSRLRFDVIENRSIYVALFRYSQLLTRRGLHRTALEISKLLLNFDPENDPMGMLMLADSFALLSGEYKWIQEMKESYQYIPLQYFPNFAASAAVAVESTRLGISGIANREGSNRSKKADKNNSAGDAKQQATCQADELLLDALLTYPMLLKPLLTAIQDGSGVWADYRLYDEGWYGDGYEDYGVLLRMSRVYAERSKLLWNSTSNKDMLVRCARKAGEMDAAAGMGTNPATGRPSSAFVRDIAKHPRVARCRALRAEAGNWLRSSGLYQNVQIADFADSTTNLPAELLAGDGADQAVGAAPLREVSVTQGALEFLQSLLPWREARDAQDPR